MNTSRRDFLHAAGATAGLALVNRHAPAEDPPAKAPGVKAATRVRKDIATLNANSPDVKALSAAVAKMKDPNSKLPECETWAGWSAIHGTVNGGFNKCQHGNWYIWPWHRMYVYYFEQIVIQLSGDANFALPYWNWSKNPTIPDLFWKAPLLDPNRAVKQGQKIPTTQFNQYVSPTTITNILNIPSFPAFGGTANGSGELESKPHNFIHNWIGGDMGTGGSPLDPIFWMHHCNCDRLYSAWINKHPGGLPTSTAWLNRQFIDFCEKGMKVSETSSTTAMGYTYDKFTPTLLATGVRPLPQVIETDGPVTREHKIAGAAAVFALSPKDGAATAVARVTAGDLDPRASAVYLELSGVKVPDNQNVRVSVFINAPNPSPELPETDEHYVTSFTFFHGPHGEAKKDDHKDDKKNGHKDAGTKTLLVDATQTLHRLYGDQAFGNNEVLNVQIVAAPLFPDRDGWKGKVQDLAPAQVKMIVSTPKE
jgi:tyrosinase